MKRLLTSLLPVIGAVAMILCTACNGGVSVADPRVEMASNPEGVVTLTPRFTWKIESSAYNVHQVGYRINLAASVEDLKNGNLLWDSGDVESDNTLFIDYAGSPLSDCSSYYWRVKANTNSGKTKWSEIQHFSTSLTDAEKWQASWIGINDLTNEGESLGGDDPYTRLAARYLRKEFSATQTVKRAMLYITAGGSTEAYINGMKVSEDLFAPAPTAYDSLMYFNTYDVTDKVRGGDNAIGIILGNGRYLPMRSPGVRGFGIPRLSAQLAIEYADGSQQLVLTDGSWHATASGPIVANNEWDGEEYDARKEMSGWNKVGYNDSEWQGADVMERPCKVFKPQPNPNIRVMECISPVSITPMGDSSYIVDMGQNMVGFLAVTLSGNKDVPVTLGFAETLKDDGTLYIDNLRSSRVKDYYTPAADGTFSWEPSFVYHGFRFVEIKGVSEAPVAENLVGKVIYDRMETTGEFETSNKVINQIHKNAYWGIRGNYRGMPTDCPQRDERLGWLGDRTTGVFGESFIFDNALLYKKWLDDIRTSVNEDGDICSVAPRYWSIYPKDITWPAAYFSGAMMLHRQFGDREGIERQYATMHRWVDTICARNAVDTVIKYNDSYGDWCMPPEDLTLVHAKDPSRQTPGVILSTSLFYEVLGRMQHFAELLGKKDHAADYAKRAADLKTAYNNRYFNYEEGYYGNNTITGNLLGLRLGLVPDGWKDRLMTQICDQTENKWNSHVSSGVIGIQHLMRGLTENGRADLALTLASQETYPSWGYMAANGATTIWELWNGNTADPSMNSGNHVMLLGDLIVWMYEDLAGISNDAENVGFRTINMHPVFVDGLDYVKASYKSISGKISSNWSRTEDGEIVWNIVVPANTNARIDLSLNDGISDVKVVKGGKYAVQDGLRITVPSGSYSIKISK